MNFTKKETSLSQQEIDNLLLEWRDSQLELNVAKKKERILRDKIVKELFDDSVEEGTENIDLGNDYYLKATKKLSYTLDKNNDKIIEVTKKLNPEVAKRLVTWSSKLSTREYKIISDEDKALINEVLTIRVSAPTLSLVEPKV